MRTAAALLLAAATAACFDPHFVEPACGPGGECPDGTSCVAGVCTARVDPEAPTTPGCPEGQVTSLSGTVLAPNGSLPLHDVMIYVPLDGDLRPLPEGASCTPCGDPPPSQALAQSGVDGTFVLRHVPAGSDLRIVLETGRWRREVVVPAVPACVDTPLEPAATRLPRSRAEGDLPRIALTTGFSTDSLECLLRKLGIDDAEFGTAGGPERIHLYRGGLNGNTTAQLAGGAPLEAAEAMWIDPARLGAYDHVLLSCPGTSNPAPRPPEAMAAMYAYAAAGGRILAEHQHAQWLTGGPPDFAAVATFQTQGSLSNLTAEVDASTARGAALASWLVAAGASTVPGKLTIAPAARTVLAIQPGVERMVHSSVPTTIQMFAITTPPMLPEGERCGRFVYSESHTDQGGSGAPFPLECTMPGLSPREKLLAYAVFDLGRCVGGP
jgi:hypothetical protein